MGPIFQRSLFLALMWRVAVAMAVGGVAAAALPQVWLIACVWVLAAGWMAMSGTRRITRALEDLEPAAASVCDRGEPVAEPDFTQMEGIVDALNASWAEVERRLGASTESRRKLEALLDSMQDAVTSVDAAGRIVWANEPMKRLIKEASGSVRPGRRLVQTIRAPEVLECVQAALATGQYAEVRAFSMPPEGRIA